MLKTTAYVITALVVFLLIGGGIHLYRVSAQNKKEMAQYEGKEITVDQNLGKVLVIYYSLSGQTQEIAEQIAKTTKADLYQIQLKEELPASPILYIETKNQLKNKKYPEILGTPPNFDTYDVVFVGSPVWWYTVSTPVLSFLNKADFKGKKVALFSTQGSNSGTFFDDFKQNAQNANIIGYESFNNLPEKYTAAVNNKITTWINSLKSNDKSQRTEN